MQETDLQGHFGKKVENQDRDGYIQIPIHSLSLPRLEYLQVHTAPGPVLFDRIMSFS